VAKISWLPEAVEDLSRLFSFLHSIDTESAMRMIDRIDNAASRLEETPLIGRKLGDERAMRELFVSFGSGAYVLRYTLNEESLHVYIVRVWHSREDWKK
jgi:plasmid stabilization system protein ParE